MGLRKNAIEALNNQINRKILIQAKEIDEEVIISIKDNGPGIPMAELDKVYIPFYTTK